MSYNKKKRLQKKGFHYCWKCESWYLIDEFDVVEDLCTYCLYPQAGKSRPSNIDYSEGVAKNVTGERRLLDDLEYIPQKQHPNAKKAYEEYKNRNLYKR